MIGIGTLLVRAAIRGNTPMDELKQIIGGKKPEPLSTTSKGQPFGPGEWGGGTFGGAPAYTPKPAGNVNTRGLVPHVAVEAQYIASTWGLEVGGFATSGHVANSDHYTGHALDAMTSNLAIGGEIVNYYITNYKAKRIKYVIWQRRIWTPGQGWHPYHGSNPHTNHVHLSFF